jgi:hypothetical protein
MHHHQLKVIYHDSASFDGYLYWMNDGWPTYFHAQHAPAHAYYESLYRLSFIKSLYPSSPLPQIRHHATFRHRQHHHHAPQTLLLLTSIPYCNLLPSHPGPHNRHHHILTLLLLARRFHNPFFSPRNLISFPT